MRGRIPLVLTACVACGVLGCTTRNSQPQAAGAPSSSQATRNTQRARRNSPQFVDVTPQSGLRFRHTNGALGRKYYPETFGSGCAFLDFDNDGWLDILLLNGRELGSMVDDQESRATSSPQLSTLALYRNNHNGTFNDVTRGSGLDVSMYAMGCCVGDYDNDGKDDVYITCGLGPSLLFHNEGNGKFRDVTKSAGVDNHSQWGTSCAWLDYDKDGYLDLFVCNYVKYSLAEDFKCSNGGIKVYCGPMVYEPESCRLYHNLGNGAFRDVTRSAGVFQETGKALGVAVWDFDEDGWLDIAVANDLTPNYLFRNNHNGRFSEVATEWGIAYGEEGVARSGMGIDVADYRNNAQPAIFISNFSREPNSFFVREREHHFSDLGFKTGMGEVSLRYLGFGLFFFDYDNDGWKDGFVSNGHIEPDIENFESPITYAQRALLFHNQKDGTFDEVAEKAGKPLIRPRVGRGAAHGDYDNDGDLDILLTNNNSKAELLRNDDGNSTGNWLQVELKGSGLGPSRNRSNRNGLGALVTVTTGKIIQRDYIRSGSSYLSQSMSRLHFGLAQARTVDSVEVLWPSGIKDQCSRVAANRIIVIEEGKGWVP